jgi:hypothetical protein
VQQLESEPVIVPPADDAAVSTESISQGIPVEIIIPEPEQTTTQEVREQKKDEGGAPLVEDTKSEQPEPESTTSNVTPAETPEQETLKKIALGGGGAGLSLHGMWEAFQGKNEDGGDRSFIRRLLHGVEAVIGMLMVAAAADLNIIAKIRDVAKQDIPKQ